MTFSFARHLSVQACGIKRLLLFS